MTILRKLILVIGLVSIVSCATPTTPEFPKIICTQPTVTKEELKILSTCKEGSICNVPHSLVLKMYTIIQKKAECIEEYKAAAGEFK